MTHDLNLELVRELHPPVDRPTGSEDTQARERARIALMAEIERVDLGRRRRWSFDRFRLRQRRLTLGLALGVAVAVAIALPLSLGGGAGSPTAAAAAVLQRLARVASVQSPVSAPGPGHYLYVDATQAGEYGQGGCATLVPEHRQSWIAANGSGRVLQTTRQGSFFSAHDKLICERSHSILLHSRGTSDMWWAPGCYSLGDASYLRGSFQDPKTLLRKMGEIEGGPPGAAEAFFHIRSFLAGSDASPELRAAIYRAAATLPGVRLLGQVTDRLGRHGIGIALTNHGSTSELILDPRDSTLLAAQMTLRGQLHEWAVYRKTAIVSRIPAPRPLRLAPACSNGLSYGHSTRGGITIMTGEPSASP